MSNDGFGIEPPSAHRHAQLRRAARWLVVIDSGGYGVARLFGPDREQVAEFDASTEETASMSKGVAAVTGASGAEWDRALAGHSADERAAALVYELSV